MASCLPGDFQVIHDPEPSSSVCVDIVAVHAIGTTRRSWEETATDKIRLTDLLRLEVPSARIMDYVYDLQVITNNGVDEAVSSLLSKLGNNRQKGSERPLVFVCHSLGGIIVQKALLRAQMDSNYTRLRWATIGVVFIQTPHGGHPDSGDNNFGGLFGGRLGGHSFAADKAYNRQASETFAKINYHFRLIAASLRVVRICTDDCEANCGNNPGEWRFGPNDPHQGVHHLEGNSCTIENNASADDTVRLVGHSIAQIVDGLYKDGIEKAALSSFEMYHSRHPETCKWLLKRPEFDKWLKCRDLPLLWVHGRPGSGKTTLTSYVVEHLEATKSQNEIQVAYFFMRGMAADPLKELLVSILRQLLERTSQGYNKAQLYRVLASIDHSSSSLSSWRFGRHLKTVLGNLDTIDTLTLVIDGLDELGELSNQIANEIVQLSFMVKESRHVKCLITSRSDCSSQSADDHVSKVNLDENYSVRQDISLVIKDKCAEFCARFPSRRKSLQSLASRFSKQPQTSFLWISLMLHDVSRYFCLDKTNLSLRIDHLPSQIEAIYQQRLASISEHHQMLCSRVFLVVAYAARPLRLGELSAALSISLSGVSDAELIVSEDFLLNRCGGLMTINEDQIVNFVHHSIREYLTSEDNRFLVGMYFLDQVQAHRLLAQACLQCLLQRQRLRVPSRDRGHSSSNHSSHGGIFTFESYAVKYWSLHYRTAESQDRYLAGMLQQLVDISFETCRESNQAPILPQKVTTGVPTSQNKVFRVCAQNGAAVLGQICLEMGVDVNTKFCRYGVSALHVAAASGHADMVELLLRKGAAINARASVQGRTALHYACFRGDTSMVKILLNHGARSDIQTMDYEETPLHMAAAGGHLEVIELLLASGAEANVATSLTEETPLHLAAAYGFVDEASYLLGARWHGRPDVEKVRRSGGPRYPGKQGDEPRLEDRSHLNRNESFGSLLSFGEPDKDFTVDMASNSRSSQSADIGARNRDGWTPLHVAAAWGNLNIVELLLEQGADINAKTFDGSTALCLAEEYGHQAVMSVLCWASQLLADEKDQRGFETICQEPYKNDDDAMNSFFQRNCQINSVFLEGYDDWTAIILDDKTPK